MAIDRFDSGIPACLAAFFAPAWLYPRRTQSGKGLLLGGRTEKFDPFSHHFQSDMKQGEVAQHMRMMNEVQRSPKKDRLQTIINGHAFLQKM